VTAAHFLSLYLFALAACATPGPNNIMLMASGVNFGLRRSLPHVLGAWTGVPLLMLTALHLAALVYLLYLAWRIATASPPASGGATAARPFTFLQAAAFQWVNPKMWMMGVTALTMFSRADHRAMDAAIIAAVFPIANGPCLLGWTLFGTMMRRTLTSGYTVRVFNVGMAILLLLSLLPVLLR
jgi:threonine/homoserine/homoserine lactone efflux protein